MKSKLLIDCFGCTAFVETYFWTMRVAHSWCSEWATICTTSIISPGVETSATWIRCWPLFWN